MGFWWPQIEFDNGISFCSFRPESWKCAICTFFKLSNTVAVLNLKIELIKLVIFTFSFVKIFHFLKIYSRNKIKRTHRILDYGCDIPFAVRICLYNYLFQWHYFWFGMVFMPTAGHRLWWMSVLYCELYLQSTHPRTSTGKYITFNF